MNLRNNYDEKSRREVAQAEAEYNASLPQTAKPPAPPVKKVKPIVLTALHVDFRIVGVLVAKYDLAKQPPKLTDDERETVRRIVKEYDHGVTALRECLKIDARNEVRAQNDHIAQLVMDGRHSEIAQESQWQKADFEADREQRRKVLKNALRKKRAEMLPILRAVAGRLARFAGKLADQIEKDEAKHFSEWVGTEVTPSRLVLTLHFIATNPEQALLGDAHCQSPRNGLLWAGIKDV